MFATYQLSTLLFEEPCSQSLVGINVYYAIVCVFVCQIALNSIIICVASEAMRSCVQSIEQRKVAARGGSSGASGSDGSSGEIGLAGEGILLIADRQIE